jgi:hypothetical protein
MNSLTELNGYVNGLSFEYTDLRYARVIFDRANADNQTKVVNEGETFPFSIGIEILDVVNYAISVPTLTVDISTVYSEGVRINWGTLPDGVSITEPINGRYVLSGVNSKAIWDQIKQPNIELPDNVPDAFTGTFTYTVAIDYFDANLGNQTKQYTVAVSVLDVTFMTTPLEFVYVSNQTDKIVNTPQIAGYLDEEYPTAVWTISATVSQTTSIDTFSSTVTGGTFTFNSATKGFTIVGSRTQVNNHLANLYIDSNANEIDFVIYYVLTNSVDSVSDSRTQAMTNRSIQYFSNPTDYTQYYIEDTLGQIDGHPLITDNSYSGSGTYTVEIYPSSTADVYLLASTGVGGTTSFNNLTKILTITGTKTQINSHLPNITMQPESDVDYLFQLFYKLTTPLGASSTKIQQLVCSSNDTEVSNISVTRSYIGNRGNSIFTTNTPQITDLDSTGVNTYTINLSCTFGSFSSNDVTVVAPFSYTGTKSQVNALFSSIKFYPNKDISANGVITYTQIKNGVTQVSTTFAVTGTSGTFQDGRIVEFTSTQTWTPTINDVLYSQYEIFLTGAGGGGGQSGGGGGGGGEGLFYANQNFSFTTYNAVVGIGGVGGGVGGAPSKGGDGSNTTFASWTARGGKGGNSNGGSGGASGNGNAGGTGAFNSSLNRFFGGGGGGQVGVGGNATTSAGGVGGDDRWYYTDKNGVLQGPIYLYAGGGGGGGGYATESTGSFAGGGRGGSIDTAAQNGAPTTSTSYAGNGGGGGATAVNLNGGSGANGVINIVIY